jgi:hypothetical protein
MDCIIRPAITLTSGTKLGPLRSDHRWAVEAWAKCIVHATRGSIALSANT